MLYIRVDMNKEIATGHLMRCLSIADAARTMGEETTFLLADSEAEAYLSERGYRFIVLHTDWRDMEGELDALFPVLAAEGVKRLLVDSYQVTETYLRRLRERVETVYLDDLNRFVYPVNALICYAIYWKKFRYEERYPETTKLYLGTRYAPLRREFLGVAGKNVRERISRVLVLSGGSDPCRASEQIAHTLEKIGGLEMDIVCGRYSGSYERLTGRYRGQNQVRLYQVAEHISSLMKEADLAISAGGTTLYELCACGVPTISYVLANNQIENVTQFQCDGIIDCAGDIRNDSLEEHLEHLLRKYSDQALRAKRSALACSLVDGNGAVLLFTADNEQEVKITGDVENREFIRGQNVRGDGQRTYSEKEAARSGIYFHIRAGNSPKMVFTTDGTWWKNGVRQRRSGMLFSTVKMTGGMVGRGR